MSAGIKRHVCQPDSLRTVSGPWGQQVQTRLAKGLIEEGLHRPRKNDAPFLGEPGDLEARNGGHRDDVGGSDPLRCFRRQRSRPSLNSPEPGVRIEENHEPMDQSVSSMAGLTMPPVISSPARDAGGRRSPETFASSSSTRKIASTFACGGRAGRSFGRPCFRITYLPGAARRGVLGVDGAGCRDHSLASLPSRACSCVRQEGH
jgi:hypothetical protein